MEFPKYRLDYRKNSFCGRILQDFTFHLTPTSVGSTHPSAIEEAARLFKLFEAGHEKGALQMSKLWHLPSESRHRAEVQGGAGIVASSFGTLVRDFENNPL